MRQLAVATSAAFGLLALWAALLQPTAEPATKHVAAASPVTSKSLFLCRGPNGLNQACLTALGKALVLDVTDDSPAWIGDRSCRADQELLAELRQELLP